MPNITIKLHGMADKENIQLQGAMASFACPAGSKMKKFISICPEILQKRSRLGLFSLESQENALQF